MYGFNAAAVNGDDDWIVPALVFYLSSMFCLQWSAPQPFTSDVCAAHQLSSLIRLCL